MALLDLSRPVNVVDRVRFYVSHAASIVAAWNDERRTRDQLGKLTSQQLNDLGMSRGDIDRIAGSGRIF